MLGNGKYSFLRDSHWHFGYKKKITLFEKEVWAYIYVYKFNATINSAKWVMEQSRNYPRFLNQPFITIPTIINYGYSQCLSTILRR